MARAAERLAREKQNMITVPIKTGSGLNERGHWRHIANRVRAEKTAAGWMLTRETKPTLPCTVLLTRVAPSNGLDDDNLVGALKTIRDAVATWVGVDDRDSATVRYRYAQMRGPWGVRIQFMPAHGEVLGRMP